METMRAHLGAERFATIGFSYLGLMTVMYAIEHPQRVERLVQLGPVPRKFGTSYPAAENNEEPPAGVAAELGKALEQMRREGLPAKDPRGYCEKEWEVMRYWLVGDPSRVGALGPGYCDLENERPDRLAKGWEQRRPEMQKLDPPPESIRKVTQPVLTVHGTKDRNAPYGAGREWACLLPDARLVTVMGAAHQSWADAPDLVFGSVTAFLEGRWPESAKRLECRAGS